MKGKKFYNQRFDQKVSDYTFLKLPTYPSPKQPFCPKWEIRVNVGLREGYVDSFP